MGLPTKAYTWEFRSNILVDSTQYNNYAGGYGTGSCTVSQVLLEMKNSFCNVGHSTFSTPWTVVGSCDRSTGAMDGVDRWIDYNDIRDVSGNESWICMQMPGMSNSQLLIRMKYASPYESRVANRYFSQDGYTGGGVSVYPTAVVPATSRNLHGNSADTWFRDANPGTLWCHAMMSSDGSQARFIVMAWNYCYAYMAFETLKNSPLARPTLAWFPDVPNLGDQANAWYKNVESNFGKCEILGAAQSVYGACQGYANAFVPEWGQNQYDRQDFTNEYAMWPLHWNCLTTSYAGYVGQSQDVYLAPTPLRQGQTTPSKEWVKLGDLWLPWDGSTTARTG